MKYSKQQTYTILAATLFLIGAIFMLVNTFAQQPWAFWTGLAFAVAAAGVYGFLILENRRIISRKLADTAPSEPVTEKKPDKEA